MMKYISLNKSRNKLYNIENGFFVSMARDAIGNEDRVSKHVIFVKIYQLASET